MGHDFSRPEDVLAEVESGVSDGHVKLFLGDDTTLGLVDFSICPHLAADGMPGNSMAEAREWAAGIPNPAYALDDHTAISVVDGEVRFVSEGHWTQLRTLSSGPDQA